MKETSIILVHSAFEDKTGKLKLPKWNIKRDIPVIDNIHFLLTKIKAENNNNLVFCYPDGTRLGGTWWQKNFYNALEKMGIVEKVISKEFYGKTTKEGWKRKRINYIYKNKRNGYAVTPHSFRHSLNTNLLNVSSNETKVQSYMGWKPVKLTQTQQGYTHFKAAGLMEIVEAIEKIYCLPMQKRKLVAG